MPSSEVCHSYYCHSFIPPPAGAPPRSHNYLMARAVVGPDGVPAHVLAAPVACGALVLVGEEDGGEAVLLHRVVAEKLEPQAVALRGDDGGQAVAAEEAVLAGLAGAHLK